MTGPNVFRVHFLSILIVMNGVMTSLSQTDCKDGAKVVQACVDKMKPIKDNPDLAFPENEAQITDSCRYLRETMDCLNNFFDGCYNAQQKELFMRPFSGFQSVISDLCVPGSLYRETVLKHIPCYKSVETEHMECIDKYSEKQKNYEIQGMSAEETAKEMCCLLDDMVDCVMTPLVEKCDKEPVDFARKTVERLITQPVEFICSALDKSECSAASSITMPGLFLLILLFIAVLKH